MADELRIGLSELLRKAMIDRDAEFLKEGVKGALPGTHGDGGPRACGSRTSRAERRAGGTAQRIPPALLGHEGRDRGAEGASGEGLELLPLAFGAA